MSYKKFNLQVSLDKIISIANCLVLGVGLNFGCPGPSYPLARFLACPNVPLSQKFALSRPIENPTANTVQFQVRLGLNRKVSILIHQFRVRLS